jgi:hypothetical protein
VPLLLRDITDAGLILELCCRECRKVAQMPPQIDRRRFPPNMAFMVFADRLRCARNGMIPEMRLLLLRPEIDREAMRRRLPVHERP